MHKHTTFGDGVTFREQKRRADKLMRLQGANIDKLHYSSILEDAVTPLILASHLGNLQIVQLLICNGANPQFASGLGNTALSLASARKHTEIVDILSDCFGSSERT